MPKVTIFPHTADVPKDRGSITLHDHASPYSVYEVTDLLFQSDTLDECVKSLTVLRQLQACAAVLIETISSRRNDLIRAELTPDLDDVIFAAERYGTPIPGASDPDVQHKVRGGE